MTSEAEAEADAIATGPAAAPEPPPADATPVVEIQGLSTVFGKGDEAFAVHENLDLTVRRGEILALVGGSGTGKTVLLRQMLGLTRPAKGSVTVLGRPASEMGRAGAASRVGMLFQHGALFSAFSVLDNVAFALREQGTLPRDLICDAAMVKLRMVGLKPEHATRMPSDLSGGMIKRVRWRARSSWTRRCCCSTSPPRASIRTAPTNSANCCASCMPRWASPW